MALDWLLHKEVERKARVEAFRRLHEQMVGTVDLSTGQPWQRGGQTGTADLPPSGWGADRKPWEEAR
jgi:hypothetical protein